MLLEITTTHRPATDLGFLLHKHPERAQTFTLPFGAAHVFYPEATTQRCTAALLLDVDPVGLSRRRQGQRFEYVNDRPYVASSFLSTALNKVLRTAMAGVCEQRPELARTAIPLTARLAALDCANGADLLRRLFEPLGYAVAAKGHGGDCFEVVLSGEQLLSALLTHLYVLVPVLDRRKHYYSGHDELEKLLDRGGDWLAGHPERELIVRRYLRPRGLANEALERLLADEAADDDEAAEAAAEAPIRLADARVQAVLAALKAAGAGRVLDAGCGEGRLLRALLGDSAFTAVAGMDVSASALEAAARRLRLDRLPPAQRERIRLFQGSLCYRDDRLRGWDAITAVEVVEHLDPPRLDTFARVLLGDARPATAILTTPNAEYNVRFPWLPAGALRHRDHRFEWTREEFRAWAGQAAERHGYGLRLDPIGAEDPELGAPTQMAVLTRAARGRGPEMSAELVVRPLLWSGEGLVGADVGDLVAKSGCASCIRSEGSAGARSASPIPEGSG